jgi:1,4-dihydroxy-2-naphthoate octaprenyltransferase
VQLWSTRLIALLKLGRFQFLVGGFVLYGLGVAMALYSGASINWTRVVWGQVIVTATQLMVHYSNDYYDFEADLNNPTPTAWSGGSRVLQSGVISRQTSLIAAIILALIALVGGLLLAVVEHTGPLVIPIVLLSVALSWEYSSPPLRLHGTGLGEISAAFVVSVLTPVLGFYLQTGYLTTIPLLALVPLYCLQLNMLLSVHIPDVEGDATVNKRTLVVRLGRPAIARIYLVLLASAYILLLPLTLIGLPLLVAFCFSLSSPLALWLGWRMAKGDWAKPLYWSRLAFFSIALLMIAALLECVAFLWSAGSR